jgi:hypothetical protein
MQMVRRHGSMELEGGCLQIHTFKNGRLVQEGLFGATEFVCGLLSCLCSVLINLKSTGGARKTVLVCAYSLIIMHQLIIWSLD